MRQGVFCFENVPKNKRRKKNFTIGECLGFNTLFMRISMENVAWDKETVDGSWEQGAGRGWPNEIMELKCAFCFGKLSQLDTQKYEAIKTIMKSKERKQGKGKGKRRNGTKGMGIEWIGFRLEL